MNNIVNVTKRGFKVLRAKPMFAVNAVMVAAASRVSRSTAPKILVGTHHKVLTVYMTRVFRAFAFITNRSVSIGMGDDLDYSADVLIDHHSQFDFSKLQGESLGIHFRRDPRDLLVSAGFYHKKSREPQLHIPQDEYGGKTYQEHVNAMETMEEVFLFELDASAGMNIRHMLDWDYDRGFLELKYEDLVVPDGGQVFREALEPLPLTTTEKSLLEGLFNYYSIFDGGSKGTKHIRDPRSKQFEQHFTETIQREFDARFAGALSKLGYE